MTAAPVALDEISDLYQRYAETLDDGPIEQWPEFFTEDCVYRVIARSNHDSGRPLAVMYCRGQAMMKDRVLSYTQLAMFAPRSLRHIVGAPRIRSVDDDGIRTRAHFLVVDSLTNEPARVQVAGKYLDRLVRRGGELRFAERDCVYDNDLIPNSLVAPL